MAKGRLCDTELHRATRLTPEIIQSCLIVEHLPLFTDVVMGEGHRGQPRRGLIAVNAFKLMIVSQISEQMISGMYHKSALHLETPQICETFLAH